MVEANAAEVNFVQIRDELIALAEQHIDARMTYKSLKVDAKTDQNIWQGAENGVALTVCMMKADGLTLEDFINFYNPDTFPDNMKLLDSNITSRKLDIAMPDNCYAMYQHIKTPIVVSNRCTFAHVHFIDSPDGGKIQLTSSRGMEKI